ncbi:MAG TPA: efflux RND transporter periplasmic adaptor subunit [Candidatus Paceibacterota bacterium]|nr:efflux RND transporter periplasmic adaptor subunit [Candidatus Paceibacterota bacterium]
MKFLHRILEHKITFIVSIVLTVGVIGTGIYFLIPAKKQLETVPVQTMDIQQTVTESGQVDSNEDVSLAFQTSGVVSSINAQVGDKVTKGTVIATLSDGDLVASLQGAQANVLGQQANLTSIEDGATPQTLSLYQQGVATAETTLVTAIQNAYLQTADAIQNKSDTLFAGASTQNPQIQIPVDASNPNLQNNINFGRVQVADKLDEIKALAAQNGTTTGNLAVIASDLQFIKSFLDTLSTQVNRLSTENSGIAQSQIDGYVSTVSAAESEANTAITNYNSAVSAWKTAIDQLATITSSSTPEAIQAQQAIVSGAQATVEGIQNQIGNTMITAPFDGTISSINLKNGELISVGASVVDMISQGNFKIDLQIPENEVAAVSVGDTANIAFTSYGVDLNATGTVASVDFSPTVENGVSTYKTTVFIQTPDPRIREGMTADVTILGETLPNVLAVPTSAVISENDGTFVLLMNPKNSSYTKQSVTIGITSGGFTQIQSGLNEGQKVATFGNQ